MKNLFFITHPPKPDSKVSLYSITQNTHNVQRKHRLAFSPPKLLFGEPYARYETNSMKARNKEDVRRFYLMGLGE
jgi:hypothetical protein